MIVLVFSGALLSDEQRKKEEKNQLKSYDVEVHLCDGRILSKGKIEIQVPDKILIIHDVDGLEFQKEITLDQVESMIFLSWKPEFIEVKKDKGKLYKLAVSQYIIKLSDGLELKVKRPLPEFLEKFTYRNRYGATVLYSFWMDLYQIGGSWFTGLSGTETGERTQCYKDVVKKIFFQDRNKDAKENKSSKLK